jgi:hypothetical protein
MAIPCASVPEKSGYGTFPFCVFRSAAVVFALVFMASTASTNVYAQTTSTPPMGWPDATAHLIQLKTTSETCISIIKQFGDTSSKAQARLAYGKAEGSANAIVSGLEVALFSSGKMTDLQALQADLNDVADEVSHSCQVATAAIPSSKGHKGLVDDIAKAAIDPLVKAVSDGIAALYKNHRADSDLIKKTIQTQLEAAKWQDFDKIPTAQ